MPKCPIALSLPAACDPTAPVMLAISGGRDSVALLHLLLDAGFKQLILCHLNHGLRGDESIGDAAFVRRLAKKHGLKCEIEAEDVAAVAEKKRLSTETAAREARHAFLLRMAEKYDVWVVLLAHHAEDQAETILANLCRGSGLAGLAGMHAVQRMDTGLHLVRPMLHARRSEIDAYLKSKRCKYREDSSNTSPKHRRNRVRHEALPLLNDIFSRDVVPQILRLGSLAEQDDDALQRQAMAFLTTEGRVLEDRSLVISPELLALHPAVSSRVIGTWLREAWELPGIDYEIIDAALGMLAPDGAAKINLPGDKHLRRKAKKLWVE
ncbi:tRNA lysidine(34) synthetase TilS [Prosthecobacter sp.]|uniref:tRNA lysidine(34) synthetase TilS n=1 Tax=Prosthecobacter sp. TaxID=1965333 RepID=UPI003784DA71